MAFVVAEGTLPHATFPPFLPTLIIVARLRKIIGGQLLVTFLEEEERWNYPPSESNYAKLPFRPPVRSFLR